MSRPDLPKIEFVLTERDRSQAARIAASLERLRRERNARERAEEARRKDKEPS